jgi:methionyl-tRNA formyltransferase
VRVVFFGTPEFAVPALRALVGEGFDVAAAVTRPDRAVGRSRSTREPSAVKLAATAEGIPVLEPARPRGDAFLAAVRALAADIGVVVAYGHLLPPALLAIPPRGMVNVHPSLLPELRGAAPVEWAILNGLEKTGVTIMQMDAGLDAGPILHQIPHYLPAEITGGELALHLAEMGAQALIEALAMLEADELKPVPQDHTRSTTAPKLTREVARLDWSRPAEQLSRWIRGLDPRPGAWTTLEGRELKLFGARPAGGAGTGAPGAVVAADARLTVACGDGATVVVDEVQPAGKERMTVGEWVRGRGVRPGQRFA